MSWTKNRFEKPREMTESLRRTFETQCSVSCGSCSADLPAGSTFFYVYCNDLDSPCRHGNFKICHDCERKFTREELLERRRLFENLSETLTRMGLGCWCLGLPSDHGPISEQIEGLTEMGT